MPNLLGFLVAKAKVRCEMDKNIKRGLEVTVLGLGKSGFAAANFLLEKGAKVKVSEIQDSPSLREKLAALERRGAVGELGMHSENFVFSSQLLVVSPGISPHTPILKRAEEQNIPVIDELELGCCFCNAPIIAVTGTNGKSTTVKLIAHLLRRKVEVFEVGNVGIPFSGCVDKISRNSWVVMEISSFQLQRIKTLRPFISLVLNITPDHMDYHSDMEEYLRCKERIFLNQNGEDFAILNADDPLSYSLRKKVPSDRYYFSTRKRVKQGVYVEDNRVFECDGKGKVEISDLDNFSLTGTHNLENCAAAVCAAHVIGLPRVDISEGLKSFRGLEHRTEKVATVRGIEFINDSKATNIDAVARAIQAHQSPLILILGGKEKGNDYSVLKELVKEKVKLLLLIGENKKHISQSLSDVVSCRECASLQAGVQAAYERAVSGDKVLFSPGTSSFDMFRDYEHRGEVFKQIVKKLRS